MKILGISAFYHDSAASLLIDGEVVAAAQEERFSRKKNDADFPSQSINFCLEKGKLKKSDLDFIVFYEKPFLKFERLIETYLNFAPKGFNSFKKAIPLWTKEKLFQKKRLVEKLSVNENSVSWKNKILFTEHHMSHAASAFYPSPFNESVILTMDGVGEWATTSIGIGRGNDIKIIKELYFPHSIGLLYSAFTYFLGFKVNSGEYKVMGLAPYGKPIYTDLILKEIVDLKEDGSFRLNQKYFDYNVGLKMTNENFNQIFGGNPRNPEEPLEQKHMDLAASIQKVIEIIIVKITDALHKEFSIDNLCLAGGVALNCVANSKILNQKSFKNIWIQPAAGDAGGSLGAALCAHYQFKKSPRIIKSNDSMKGCFLGPSFNKNEVRSRLTSIGAQFHECTEDEIIDKASSNLQSGLIVGWFQGSMEFGPRSLGNRSILADPRNPMMQKNLNLKIKYRESFRPFAPAVLESQLSEWFEIDRPSPYMLLVSNLKKERQKIMTPKDHNLFGIDKLNVLRSEVPSITHVDYSARIQTVHKETNPFFYKLIQNFYQKTNCPMLVNTSFNVRGEPIVCTPEDAFRCFMGTEIDILVIGNAYLIKEEQIQGLKNNYHKHLTKD